MEFNASEKEKQLTLGVAVIGVFVFCTTASKDLQLSLKFIVADRVSLYAAFNDNHYLRPTTVW